MTQARTVFQKGFKIEAKRKKVCWFMLLPILATIIVSGNEFIFCIIFGYLIVFHKNEE